MRSEIKSLTGLRGIAAFWVMVGHYFSALPSPVWLHNVISHMYLAVDFFMILSGFVLAMTYETRFSPVITWPEYARFLQHRLARLFPLYALITTLCLVMMSAGIGDNSSTRSVAAIIANYLMAQSWWWPDDSISGTGWSLSIEWGLNIIFPVFVLLLLHAPARIAALLTGLAMLGLAALALQSGQIGTDQPLTGAIDWYYAPDSIIRCGSEFMLGMFAWRIRGQALWLGRDAAMLTLIVLILVSVSVPHLDVAFVLVSCLLVVGCAAETSRVGAWFGIKLLHWLGTISFSIYLIHLAILPLYAVLISWISGVAPTDYYHVNNYTDGAACIAVVLALSSLSFYRFERPAQKWLKQRMFWRTAVANPPINNP